MCVGGGGIQAENELCFQIHQATARPVMEAHLALRG